jgi:hypothetical protein
VIPSGLTYQAEALQDTVKFDFFCPPRQDWLNKTDAYLRDECVLERSVEAN